MAPSDGTTRVAGSCLCGRVQYQATGPFADFRYCHCERCRKATGSAHAANLFIPKERFSWTAGEADIVLFVHVEAENYPRGFCRHCGAPVPRLGRDGKNMAIPAGTLEQDPGIRPTQNIYWSLRAPWFVSPAELPTHDLRPEPKKP